MKRNTASSPPPLSAIRSLVPEFCHKHGIARLEVFGSVARGDAREGSDVDLLVTFRSDVRPGLEFFAIQEELELLLGCDVDLLTRRSVERSDNPIRRRSIPESVRVLYADQANSIPA